MHLVNFPKLRIQQYPQGWVPEIQIRTWYGARKWVHIISYVGYNEKPVHYSTQELAYDRAITFFGWVITA